MIMLFLIYEYFIDLVWNIYIIMNYFVRINIFMEFNINIYDFFKQFIFIFVKCYCYY
jgi:hypothetical protein